MYEGVTEKERRMVVRMVTIELNNGGGVVKIDQ